MLDAGAFKDQIGIAHQGEGFGHFGMLEKQFSSGAESQASEVELHLRQHVSLSGTDLDCWDYRNWRLGRACTWLRHDLSTSTGFSRGCVRALGRCSCTRCFALRSRSGRRCAGSRHTSLRAGPNLAKRNHYTGCEKRPKPFVAVSGSSGGISSWAQFFTVLTFT